jgi:hypothetical protein
MHFVNTQHLITANTLHLDIFNVSRCFILQFITNDLFSNSVKHQYGCI